MKVYIQSNTILIRSITFSNIPYVVLYFQQLIIRESSHRILLFTHVYPIAGLLTHIWRSYAYITDYG